MSELLEACNLAFEGCGRIREYAPVITKTLTLEQSLKAIKGSGALIVSVAVWKGRQHCISDKMGPVGIDGNRGMEA